MAGRLVEVLSHTYGKDQVFIDVDKIEPGLDFNRELDRKLANCAIMLAVIGPGWLNATDEDGARRLDNPDDYVRKEIEQALSRDIRLIPLLADGARMPKSIDLPETLRPLVSRQATMLEHNGFNASVNRLVEVLKKIVPSEGIVSVEAKSAIEPVPAASVAPSSPQAVKIDELPPALAAELSKLAGVTPSTVPPSPKAASRAVPDATSSSPNLASMRTRPGNEAAKPSAQAGRSANADSSRLYSQASQGAESAYEQWVPQPQVPASNSSQTSYGYGYTQPQTAAAGYEYQSGYGTGYEQPAATTSTVSQTARRRRTPPVPPPVTGYEEEYVEEDAPQQPKGNRFIVLGGFILAWFGVCYLAWLGLQYFDVAGSGWGPHLAMGLLAASVGLLILEDNTGIDTFFVLVAVAVLLTIFVALLWLLYGWYGALMILALVSAIGTYEDTSYDERDGLLLAKWTVAGLLVGIGAYCLAETQAWSLPSLGLPAGKLSLAIAAAATSLWQAISFENHRPGSADGLAKALVAVPPVVAVFLMFGIEGAGIAAVGGVLAWMIWVSVS